MDEVEDIDVEQIMAEARQSIASRGIAEDSTVRADVRPGARRGQAASDLSYLHAAADIQNIPLTSHRPVVGSVVVAVKKVLQQLLTPIFNRQVAYNSASALALTQTREELAALDLRQKQAEQTAAEQLAGLDKREAAVALQVESLERLVAQATDVEARLRQELLDRDQRHQDALREARARADARAELLLASREARIQEEVRRLWEALGATGREATERVSRAERKLRRILHAMDEGDAVREPRSPETAPANVEAISRHVTEPAFDYAGFEERFRGTEDDIKNRQRAYLPYFAGSARVLDIGCGRGEFLELLRGAGIEARGVDLDLDMVLLCKDKGLDAERGDAFAALEAIEDASLGGVFSAQLIEHLHPLRVIELVRLCHKKLAPNGVLVLETPNPACLMVFAESFYMDPSHVQPVHPKTMEYLLEAAGFGKVALAFSAPVDPAAQIPSLEVPGADLDAFNRGIERLNSLLFGFQDYAVIGWKAPVAGRQGIPAAELAR